MSLKAALDPFAGNYSTLFTSKGGTLVYHQNKWVIRQGPVTAKKHAEIFDAIAKQLSREHSFEGIQNLEGFIQRVNEVWFSRTKYGFSSNSEEIRFSSKTPEYQFLSNFESTLVLVDGRVYCSSEHAYQSLRKEYIGADESEQNAPSSAAASKKQGKKAVSKWSASATEEELEAYRQKVVPLMQRIVHCKFHSNPVLREALLKTHPAALIEQTDSEFWGEGRDGHGKNHLGQILAAERERMAVTLDKEGLPLG